MSALFTQCPGDTVQTGTRKVDPAPKFKCTRAGRDILNYSPTVMFRGTHCSLVDNKGCKQRMDTE